MAASGLSCIMQDLSLQYADSVVVVLGFSCSLACGILVPQAGIEPVFPTLEGGFLTTGPPGKTPIKFYNTDFCSFLGRAISSCLRTFACAVLKTWNTFLLLYSPLLTLQAWVHVSLPQGGLPALLFELCTSPGNPIRV